jgi:hypothetical protein
MKIQAVRVHPLQDLVEGDVEDGLDLVLAVDARGHGGEDGELALALGHGVGERTDAILVGRLHAVAVVPVRHGEVIVAPDYARHSPTLQR